jgi:hypothetical protein
LCLIDLLLSKNFQVKRLEEVIVMQKKDELYLIPFKSLL